MDAANTSDRCLCFRLAAVGGQGDEPCRAPQPPMHVVTKIRMVQHPSQDGRMKHLEQQPSDASDHH